MRFSLVLMTIDRHRAHSRCDSRDVFIVGFTELHQEKQAEPLTSHLFNPHVSPLSDDMSEDGRNTPEEKSPTSNKVDSSEDLRFLHADLF